jgi:hypothetical protein
MNTLRADSYRAASHLAVAGTLLLVFACGAWSQTYSSPVRITNTEAAPVYVAPVGGKMAVQVGNTVNVTAPSASPLPVAQQGPVTVNGTVALSGTPQVALSATGNAVELAGTPVIRQWAVTLGGGAYHTFWSLTLHFLDKAIEAETVTAICSFPVGQKPVKTQLELQADNGAGTRVAFPFLMTLTGSSPDYNLDFWSGSLPGKVYIAPNTYMSFQVVRTPHVTDAACWVSIAGRERDPFTFQTTAIPDLAEAASVPVTAGAPEDRGEQRQDRAPAQAPGTALDPHAPGGVPRDGRESPEWRDGEGQPGRPPARPSAARQASQEIARAMINAAAASPPTSTVWAALRTGGTPVKRPLT